MRDDQCFLFDIPDHPENDGRLIVVEAGREIPFDVRRIFWVRDTTEGAERGQHANKETRLVLIAVSGSLDVEVSDDKDSQTYHLDSPTKGLYIDAMLWRTMKNFSKGAIVTALCDRPYSPGNETYEDHDEYLRNL